MDILIVDDEPSVCNVLQRALRRFGFMTSAVGNDLTARMIFITGLCDSDRIRDITERTGRPVITKPIDMQQTAVRNRIVGGPTLTVMTGNAHLARDGYAVTKAY